MQYIDRKPLPNDFLLLIEKQDMLSAFINIKTALLAKLSVTPFVQSSLTRHPHLRGSKAEPYIGHLLI